MLEKTSQEALPLITDIPLQGKRVFLRADLNVPLENGSIANDHRLQALLPTIDYIQTHGGKVILATHIGRPPASRERNYFDETLSTKNLIPWFEKKGKKVTYEGDLRKAIDASHQNRNEILLLENLRFFNGEKEVNIEFAELLADLADIYINDAFGMLHRSDTSVTLLPEIMHPRPCERLRLVGFGLLVQKEIEALTNIKAGQPLLVLGGSKIKTKLPMLKSFLEQPEKKRVKTILIGGAIANSFLATPSPLAHELLELAKTYNVTIHLPVDVLAADGTIHDASSIEDPEAIVDIGPKTIALFQEEIKKAPLIFTNGTMGIYEEGFVDGTQKILEAIGTSATYSVIGGGDAVAAAYTFGLKDTFDFLSTGGGATLAFLGSKSIEEFRTVEAMRKPCK